MLVGETVDLPSHLVDKVHLRVQLQIKVEDDEEEKDQVVEEAMSVLQTTSSNAYAKLIKQR